jgi:hypothetical protein
MLNTLIVALFAVLRFGIPAAILLILGEYVKRHNQNPGNLRGA